METPEDKMTAQHSIEIIRKTIEDSRRTIAKQSWQSMLIWGISSTVIALIVGHLWAHTSLGPAANFFWALLGLTYIGEYICVKRHKCHATTFVSKTLSIVWSSFGIIASLTGFSLGLLAATGTPLPLCEPSTALASQNITPPITAIIIMMMSIAGVITGRLLLTPVITVCCLIGGTVCFLLAIPMTGPNQMIVMAMACVICLVIPAIIIKLRAR